MKKTLIKTFVISSLLFLICYFSQIALTFDFSITLFVLVITILLNYIWSNLLKKIKDEQENKLFNNQIVFQNQVTLVFIVLLILSLIDSIIVNWLLFFSLLVWLVTFANNFVQYKTLKNNL